MTEPFDSAVESTVEWAIAGTYDSVPIPTHSYFRNNRSINSSPQLDPSLHTIRELLSFDPQHWVVDTRLKGDRAEHEWVTITRLDPKIINVIELQRQSILKPNGHTGVGFNTYFHCALDRGLEILSCPDTNSEYKSLSDYKSLRVRARSCLHLGTPEQEYLLDYSRASVKVSLPRVANHKIPISQALRKRLSGFMEDCPLCVNDACVLCVMLALRKETGVHPEYVKRIDAFVTEVCRQVAFKGMGLVPLVEDLEERAKVARAQGHGQEGQAREDGHGEPEDEDGPEPEPEDYYSGSYYDD